MNSEADEEESNCSRRSLNRRMEEGGGTIRGRKEKSFTR